MQVRVKEIELDLGVLTADDAVSIAVLADWFALSGRGDRRYHRVGRSYDILLGLVSGIRGVWKSWM